MEPSYAIKRRNGYQTEGRRPALSAGLRPQLELWLGLAWLTIHTSYLHPALEDGTDRGFRNVGRVQTDAGDIPKRTHTKQETSSGRTVAKAVNHRPLITDARI